MGVKLSKYFKRSYIVSEGVQTDISIQSCDEVFDKNSFITPPRNVQHICDPRSISRGIVRTPIMCKVHEEILSPTKDKKKPYLETNLDDVLPPYHPPDPCDHLIKVDKTAPIAEIFTKANSVCSENMLTSLSKSEETQNPLSCNIEILESDVTEVTSYDCSSLEVDKSYNIESYAEVHLTIKEETLGSESIDNLIEANKILNGSLHINNSETVEKVCQKILDELLDSKDDIHVDELNDTDEELFLNGNISEIVESMKNLCIEQPEPSYSVVPNSITYGFDKLLTVPTSSKLITNKVALIHSDNQYCNSASPNKRKPLGEVNTNIQQNRPPFSPANLNLELDNSPLKSMLPLLPSQALPPTSKPHRSKWDTENTLII